MKAILAAPLLICALHAQGPLAPTGGPAPTQKSLQEIWDKLRSLQSTVAQQQQQISFLAQQNTALLESAGVSLPWQFSNVDTSAEDGYPSLAFSPSGAPSMAYNSAANLHFAIKSGSGWTATAVPGAGTILGAPSLAYTPGGHAIIAYRAPGTGGLKFAEFDGTAWTVTTVDVGDTGYFPDLAVSPAGEPAIAYDDPEESRLCLARFTGGAWEFETITQDFSNGRWPSLAFRSDGAPAVAFKNPGSEYPFNLGIYFAIKEGNTWHQETVVARGEDEEDDDEFSSPSLAFSPTGEAWISYDSYTSQGFLNYARREYPDDWTHDDIFSAGDWGFGSTIAFNAVGVPVIAFLTSPDQDETDSSLAYAVLKGTGWDISYAGRVAFNKFDSSVSMAFTPTGQPAMAYFNPQSSKLSYVVRGVFVNP